MLLEWGNWILPRSWPIGFFFSICFPSDRAHRRRGTYRYLPQRPPPWRHAFIGGLILAILWEMAKHLFSNYVTTLAVYSRLYGSLLFVVLFLLWTYYSALLFLFGAEIVRRLQPARER